MRRRSALGLILLSSAWGFADGFFTAACLSAAAAMALGGAWLVASSPGSWRRVTMHGAAGALTTAALQAFLLFPLPVVMAHWHDVPGLPVLAVAALGWLGVHSSVDAQGALAIACSSGTTSVSMTWELAALPTLLRLAAGCAVLAPAALWGRCLIALIVAASLRLLVMLAALCGGAEISAAFEPAVTLATFLPMAFTMPRGTDELRENSRPSAARPPAAAAAAVLLVIAGCLAGAAVGWRPAGARGAGRVLIDESRSGWEPTSIPFDQKLYGQRSLYNYALWKEWITLHFRTDVTRDPLTPERLAATDVLVIKTPTSPYDHDSVRAIESFVRGGGGLWLIGDHTNLFGMATVLNRVAEPYGIAFEHDDTFPLDHEASDRFVPEWLAAHPVLRGIREYPFETSCSLRVPWRADHIIIGRRLGSEPADYGHVNFFGDIRLQASERFGAFTQAASVRHGKGRVLAFTDSTNFSNFSMLWPGRRELVINSLDWLNRVNRSAAQPAAPLITLAILVAAASLALGPPRRFGLAAACWAALAGFVAVAWASSRHSHDAAGEVPARSAWRTMAFESGVSRPKLDPQSPILSLREPTWTEFNALFINAARAGVWPEVAQDLDDALRADAVVMVHPPRSLPAGRLRALERYLERGGRLLVVESALNEGLVSRHWLSRFGVVPQQTLKPGGREGGMVPALSLNTAEGARRKVTRAGAVLAWKDIGPGRVMVMADGALFSDRAVGGVYSPVDQRGAGIYESQAETFTLLLEPLGPAPATRRLR